MKTLRRISAATILSLTLAVSVLAGHIDTPGAKPTPATGGATQAIVLTILSVIYR